MQPTKSTKPIQRPVWPPTLADCEASFNRMCAVKEQRRQKGLPGG